MSRTSKLLCWAVAIAAFACIAVAQPASAATVSPLLPGCAIHSLTVTPLGPRTMVDTYVDNECARAATFTITYTATGPCPHVVTYVVEIPKGAVDVVTTYDGPCAGHYSMRQRITGDGKKLGTDTVEFDSPG
jgi:hypothetical protein